MATVLFQTLLRRQFGVSSVQVPLEVACSLDQLISACEKEIGQPLRPHILDKNGEISRGMVLLNGRNVLLLQGLQTEVQPDDEVNFFPPAGGG